MPTRIPWSRHEVALLIDAYLRVTEGADLGKTATQLSLTLRNMALRAGIDIDDTYRNVNGMKMQLGDVQYLFTSGKQGLSGASSLIREVFEMRKRQPEDFKQLLKEAIQLSGQPMSIDASFDTADEWKKFIHSIPALYIAVEKDSSITVGKFLQVKDCAETSYDQLQLSVRALNCLEREHLEHKSVSDILNMPLARLAGMRNAGAKTINEILDAVVEYARQHPALHIDESLLDAGMPESSSQALSFLKPYAEQIAETNILEENVGGQAFGCARLTSSEGGRLVHRGVSWRLSCLPSLAQAGQ